MTIHRPIVTTDGVTYATYELWWAEVKRIATERHGPRETRYKKAPQPRSAFTTRNTWSDESAPSESVPAGDGPVVGTGSVRTDAPGRMNAQEEVQEGRHEAPDEDAQTSNEETEGTDAGAITRNDTRDRDRARDTEGTERADHDGARDGDDSRDRADRGTTLAKPLLTSAVDAPPASGPHGAQTTASREDPAAAST